MNPIFTNVLWSFRFQARPLCFNNNKHKTLILFKDNIFKCTNNLLLTKKILFGGFAWIVVLFIRLPWRCCYLLLSITYCSIPKYWTLAGEIADGNALTAIQSTDNLFLMAPPLWIYWNRVIQWILHHASIIPWEDT